MNEKESVPSPRVDNVIQFPHGRVVSVSSNSPSREAKILSFPSGGASDARIENLFTMSFETLVKEFDDDETLIWLEDLCSVPSARHQRKLVEFVANSPHGVFETEMVTDILGSLSRNRGLHEDDINAILNLSIAHDFDYEWNLASCENLSLSQVARLVTIASEREVRTADKLQCREEDHPFSDILFFLAHNPGLGPEALTLVVEVMEDDLVVLEQVLNNPNTNKAVRHAVPCEVMDQMSL